MSRPRCGLNIGGAAGTRSTPTNWFILADSTCGGGDRGRGIEILKVLRPKGCAEPRDNLALDVVHDLELQDLAAAFHIAAQVGQDSSLRRWLGLRGRSTSDFPSGRRISMPASSVRQMGVDCTEPSPNVTASRSCDCLPLQTSAPRLCKRAFAGASYPNSSTGSECRSEDGAPRTGTSNPRPREIGATRIATSPTPQSTASNRSAWAPMPTRVVDSPAQRDR